jgi:hypothetical protein
MCGLQNSNSIFAQKPGLNLQSFYNNLLQQQQSKFQLPAKDQLNTSSNPQQLTVDSQSSNNSPQQRAVDPQSSNISPQQQPTYETCGSGGGSNSTEEVLIIEKPSADELLRQVIT